MNGTSGAAPLCVWCERDWPREYMKLHGRWGYWHSSVEGAPLRFRLCVLLADAPHPEECPHCRKESDMIREAGVIDPDILSVPPRGTCGHEPEVSERQEEK